LRYEFKIYFTTPLVVPRTGRLFFEIGTENAAFKEYTPYFFTTAYYEENRHDDVVFFSADAETTNANDNEIFIYGEGAS